MSTVEYEYTNRAKCPHCGALLWTTDNICDVVCSCHEYTLTPSDIGDGLSITDEEHSIEVYKEIVINSTDTLLLTEV